MNNLITIHCENTVTLKRRHIPDTDFTHVVIPSGIQTLDESVFQGYEKLSQVTFPTSLCRIRQAAFSSCLSFALDMPLTKKDIST